MTFGPFSAGRVALEVFEGTNQARTQTTPGAGTPEESDEFRAGRLELVIARLVARQVSGQIGYRATFNDERGVSHYAFTIDPAYADLSPENAASQTRAVAAFGRAIERCRATVTGFRPAP